MRFKLPYNLYRFMGITGLFLIGYIVVIGIFGNTDISSLLPTTLARNIQVHWPDLPFFKTQKFVTHDDTETFYTVPTRQLTPEEIARLKATGPPPKSVPVEPGETTAATNPKTTH